MQISYTTKEEANAAQQEAFLKLSGAERVMLFIKLSTQAKKFATQADDDRHKGNFVIEMKAEED